MPHQEISTSWPRPAVTTLDLPKPPGAFFDEAAADKAVRFFTLLKHTAGDYGGKPFVLEPWQSNEIVRPLFGWKRADGKRLYREAYVRVARKNGKSTLAAGLEALLLFADGEPGARVYSAAVDRDQAREVFDAVSEMIRGSDVLSPEKNPRVKVYARSILYEPTTLPGTARLKLLGSDTKKTHGLNASGVVIDELHAHPTRDLYDVLSTSVGARSQPLVISITTAGVWAADSICVEKDEYTRAVAVGHVSDPAFLGVIYALDEQDDWKDEDVWLKANPNLGVSISADYLRRERDKAAASPAAQNTFRMLHTNEWVQQSTRWIDLSLWDENAGSVVEPDLAGKVCYGGLDLASVSDLTAWVMLFPGSCRDHEECVQVLARFFCPESVIAKGRNARLYQQWVQGGWLEQTGGNATDYAFVRERITRDAGKFRVENLNVDYLFQGAQLASELIDESLPINAMRQGFMAFALPMKEFERLLLERKLHHGGNPILRWMADNVVVRRDPAGNLKPDKEKSREKIDGIVALVMALEPLTLEHYEDDEDRGLPFLDLEEM
jgi:phage terminase large subunit-like protein